MTLPSSGPMTAAMINVEMGLNWNAPFSITSSFCRQLAGRPSGPIKFSDFYGKTGTVRVTSDLLVGYQKGDAWVPTRYGYATKERASNNGSYPAIGSLTPPYIAYPSGTMPTVEVTWYPSHRWLVIYVPDGYQHAGTLQFMTMAGDVFAEWVTTEQWYSDGGWKYFRFSGVSTNPFPAVGTTIKVAFKGDPVWSVLVAGTQAAGGGYQQMAGYALAKQGIPATFGSLSPQTIMYPGGAMDCSGFSWVNADAGYFVVNVPVGQERYGTFFIRDMQGNILRAIDGGTWYNEGVYMTYNKTPFANPFVAGQSYYVSMDK